MITIEKINATKRIYHFLIRINGRCYDSRDNYFVRKKDAQKYIDNNKSKLENLSKSIKYKKASPFDVPNEPTMIIREINSIYNKHIFFNKTEFQADNKIQVSARKSTNNNPELKTKGENDE